METRRLVCGGVCDERHYATHERNAADGWRGVRLPSEMTAQHTLPPLLPLCCILHVGKSLATWAVCTRRQEWAHDFTLRITYTINAASLKMTAEVRAPTEDIEMALLFHTYLRVGSVKRTEIIGLQGLHYRPHAPDNAAASLEEDNGVCFEQRQVVTIAGPTDRIYLDHTAGRLVEVIDSTEYGLA